MINYRKQLILEPKENCQWAEKMVLNPAMVSDLKDDKHLCMLFRATGPWEVAKLPNQPLPYPIFLGFGESFDGGESWDFDFATPAMSPRLTYDQDKFIAESFRDGVMFDYANGCIEDPRLFYFENELYLSVACRAFPPGPYWEIDEPTQCMPDWAKLESAKFGCAVTQNLTVTMLYKVDLEALKNRDYARSFSVVAPLHQPNLSDDRDVFLFPRRLEIEGKSKIVCIHRPKTPWNYEAGKELKTPSIFLAFGDELTDFWQGKAESILFATSELKWEKNRIGASFAPIEIEPELWLLPYHGKEDDKVGYTQSFMLLKETGTQQLEIVSRPEERMFFASEDWELEGEFTIPCMFSCSGVLKNDGNFLMGYGAADKKVGLLEVRFEELIDYLKS